MQRDVFRHPGVDVYKRQPQRGPAPRGNAKTSSSRVTAPNPISSTIPSNRFVHFDCQLLAEQWCKGMLEGWPQRKVPVLPADWKARFYPATRALIAGYIRARGTEVQLLPKDETQAGRAWPSGRSWDMAAICLAGARSVNANFETEVELIKGCVGPGPALGFSEWFTKANLPDPEMLLKDPLKCKLPEQVDILLVVFASCLLYTSLDSSWHLLVASGFCSLLPPDYSWVEQLE